MCVYVCLLVPVHMYICDNSYFSYLCIWRGSFTFVVPQVASFLFCHVRFEFSNNFRIYILLAHLVPRVHNFVAEEKLPYVCSVYFPCLTFSYMCHFVLNYLLNSKNFSLLASSWPLKHSCVVIMSPLSLLSSKVGRWSAVLLSS